MGSNWITKTIEQITEDRRRFFWNAFAALEINKISGDYVEFGSYGGNSLSVAYEAISQISPRHMWAFDSFAGLPEITDPRDERWRSGLGINQGGVGNFYADCDKLGVPREAYTAVEGYFSDTLPALGAAGAPADIAIAYVDCNMLWTSTEVSGERSALDEFLTANPQWHFERYKEVHYAGTSFVVEHAGLVKGR